MSVRLTPQFSAGFIGTTAQRPTRPSLGQLYLDTTLVAAGRPIWCSSEFVNPATAAVWVNSLGVAV